MFDNNNNAQIDNKSLSILQILCVSFIALLLGHLMFNTYIKNEVLNLAGLFITAFFIYYFTLKDDDLFSFIMVIYFCSTFPYIPTKGGGFNLVSVICIPLYLISHRNFFKEKRVYDFWFSKFVGMFVFSSIFGWLFNFTGQGMDIFYSVLTFSGVILLLIMASRLDLTSARVKIFLQLNVVLIIYSTIASVNKYIHLVTFDTPMMPIYGKNLGYFEGGGLIGSSPLYGEHSLVLFLLFAVYFIVRNKTGMSKIILVISAFVALINVFMSISRSVFLLSLAGLAIIFILQFKVSPVKLFNQIFQLSILAVLGIALLLVINQTGLGYTFKRMDKLEGQNKQAGGITIDRILDGRAFNRGVAFKLSRDKYNSRDNWLVGYGWGVGDNNRDAFYINSRVKRGSAHSQVYAVLFLFGWAGFIAYWGLLLRIILKSYRITGNKNFPHVLRVMAFFFFIAFGMFTFNEIKADSVSYPTYFAVTMIWVGMAYAVTDYRNLFKPNIV